MNANEFYAAIDAAEDPVDFVIKQRAQMKKERRISLMAHDNRYGNCERCGKPCTPCYAQQWRKVGRVGGGWISSGFGHAKCLQDGEYSECAAQVVEQ